MQFLQNILYILLAPLQMLVTAPLKLFAGSKRLMSLSLPARAAMLVFVFLFVVLIVGAIVAAFTSLFLNWLMRPNVIVLIVLLFVIPLVVYQGLKLWLAGDVSRFPEIDEAWESGMAALRSEGFDIQELPLFLVVGGDHRTVEGLFTGSGMAYDVNGAPDGRQALKWYVNENGIFLACCVGQLGTLSDRVLSGQATGGITPGIGATMGGESGSPAPPQPQSITGTMVADGPPPAGPPPAGPPPAGPTGITGTIVAGGNAPAPPAGGGTMVAGGAAPPSGGTFLTTDDKDDATEQLEYVVRLLKRARQPLCAANGVLTLLPMHVLDNVVASHQNLPDAVDADLDTLRTGMMLRCPVIAMVSGMEREAGFHELIKRIGQAKAQANRFGKGYHVWNPPTAENLDALSSHACSAFEDSVYGLFREPDGLEQEGNADLFRLLCKLRGDIKTRLRNVLTRGFAFEPSQRDVESLLFGGCYFAATGGDGMQHAFIRSVLEKMVTTENELKWTEAALREDDRYHRFAQICLIANALCLAGIVGVSLYYWGGFFS